jgi:hypothetical protein
MVSLLIGCFLNLGVINNQSPGELLSSIAAISLTIFLLGYIVWQYYFLMTRNLDEKRIVETYGELYDGLKLRDNQRKIYTAPYLYHACLNLRRLLLISLIFLLSSTQPIILYNLSLFYLAFGFLYYLITLSPFENPRDYTLEVINQSLICLTYTFCWPLVNGHLSVLTATVKNVCGILVVAAYCIVSAVGIFE